jgi:hypothetical protein
VNATVRLDPPEAAEDAKWLSVTAWQGDGLVVNHLEKTGEGTYRTTEPIPVYGNWKALLRLHEGRSMPALPIFLPEDPAIPAKEVPATASFQREFGEERMLLQRERKQDVAGGLYPAGSIVVALIALSLIGLLGWALVRVARAAAPPEPPRRPEATRAPRAVAPGAAS